MRTPEYEAAIKSRLTAEAEREFVENFLMANPRAGAVLPGTGGFRTLRVPLEGRGKRGGARLVYYYVARHERVYLVAFFTKNVKENLTHTERAALRRLALQLGGEQ